MLQKARFNSAIFEVCVVQAWNVPVLESLLEEKLSGLPVGQVEEEGDWGDAFSALGGRRRYVMSFWLSW